MTIHQKPEQIRSFSRLDMLWERYPQYHEKKRFSSLDALLEDILLMYHLLYTNTSEDLAVEYQGVQHYLAIDFFGGEEALAKRQELDQLKKEKCLENQVRLIEWPYEMPPTKEGISKMIDCTCSSS